AAEEAPIDEAAAEPHRRPHERREAEQQAEAHRRARQPRQALEERNPRRPVTRDLRTDERELVDAVADAKRERARDRGARIVRDDVDAAEPEPLDDTRDVRRLALEREVV